MAASAGPIDFNGASFHKSCHTPLDAICLDVFSCRSSISRECLCTHHCIEYHMAAYQPAETPHEIKCKLMD